VQSEKCQRDDAFASGSGSGSGSGERGTAISRGTAIGRQTIDSSLATVNGHASSGIRRLEVELLQHQRCSTHCSSLACPGVRTESRMVHSACQEWYTLRYVSTMVHSALHVNKGIRLLGCYEIGRQKRPNCTEEETKAQNGVETPMKPKSQKSLDIPRWAGRGSFAC
jgi:hypothetical protein